MYARYKKVIKPIFQKMGVFSIINFIARLFDPHKIKRFNTGLKYYLFNDWLTHFPYYPLRRFYLKKVLRIQIGKSTFIHMGSRFTGSVIIGNNSVVGRNCVLLGDICIKDNVSITAETYIFTNTHIKDSPSFEAYSKEVVINDFVWIGARAMILPGVHIGKGAILGAASTATKDIPEYSVFAGAPAKNVGKRTELLEYKLVYFPPFE